ncbi:MAG: hypothetical protein B6D36_15045, partial [Planctomycetes bacterium UTPLA1]
VAIGSPVPKSCAHLAQHRFVRRGVWSKVSGDSAHRAQRNGKCHKCQNDFRSRLGGHRVRLLSRSGVLSYASER